jgi:hypothetical protein
MMASNRSDEPGGRARDKDETGRPCVEQRWWTWLQAWTMLTLPALFPALLLWGAATVVLVGLFAGIVAGSVYAVQRFDGSDSSGPSLPEALRATGQVMLGAALAAVAVGVAGQLTLAAACCLVVAAGATSPPVLDLARRVGSARWSTQTMPPIMETVERRDPLLRTLLAAPPHTLSNEELCRAWRRSFLALEAANTVAERSAVVRLRMAYLDQLEDRDAPALAAWLASGARAASGPDRFLTDTQGSGGQHPEAA